MFLIIVDAHSKSPEVSPVSSTTASKTIEVLQVVITRYGIPEQLVSDNWPQFSSAEFAHYAKAKFNSIKLFRSAPYHPSTNGLAECFVQTLKRAMKEGEQSGKRMS